MNISSTKCGYVAIIGRPNVGKSTLLNHLIGQKLSITSRKPQTTRHRILGIKTENNAQIVYVDTPGLHQKNHTALNRYMNRVASSAIFDVDVIVFMVEGLIWKEEDEWILNKIKRAEKPVILAVNKVDKVPDKALLLPHLEFLQQQMTFTEIMPISASKGKYLDELEQTITRYLPEGPFLFPSSQLTDRSERFLVAEIIREKLMRNLGQELPYATAVEIERFKTEKGILRIAAVIYVEKDGQKAIIIGEKGSKLKVVGQQSRLELERLFGQKIFLQLWVKVKQSWSDDEKALRSLGYE